VAEDGCVGRVVGAAGQPGQARYGQSGDQDRYARISATTHCFPSCFKMKSTLFWPALYISGSAFAEATLPHSPYSVMTKIRSSLPSISTIRWLGSPMNLPFAP